MVFDKLQDMAKQGVATPCVNGSATPPSFAPYNINQELVRAFQADAKLDLHAFLHQKAADWIGNDLAADLVKVWKHSDEAYRSFPLPIWIYSSWGVWYRLSTRPIVPNIEAISEEDRAYYEQFLLATSHNRCRIDFRYDVGFDLVDAAHAHHCLGLINRDLFPQMDAALKLLKSMKGRATTDAAQPCVQDTFDRMQALYCWYRTQRNVTAWVAGVHSYIETTNKKVKKDSRRLLRDMVLDEIENTQDLLNLWETSKAYWMILSDGGETTFIYYKNFGEQLKRKIALMKDTTNLGNDGRAYLQKHGVLDALKDKTQEVKNIKGAIEAVKSGDAKWTFLYSTDAERRKSLKVLWRIAAEEMPPLVYSVARPVSSRDPEVYGKVTAAPGEVHFHEVGALDTVADAVAAASAFVSLRVDEAWAGPVTVGCGAVRTAHGLLPVPAPATLELLKGAPVRPGTCEGECATPTGAALVVHFCRGFSAIPPMKVERIGYGAGSRELPHPNVFRAVVGEAVPPA